MTFQEQLGRKIRDLRDRRDWSQTDLAHQITAARRAVDPDSPEVSLDTISRVERGFNATTGMLSEIASALGYSLLELTMIALGVTQGETEKTLSQRIANLDEASRQAIEHIVNAISAQRQMERSVGAGQHGRTNVPD